MSFSRPVLLVLEVDSWIFSGRVHNWNVNSSVKELFENSDP